MPDKFPEPVSGQPIPRSWFARLVRYINSLRPRGDGRYITVSRTPDGATISPTPALLQLVSGGAPGESGSGATGIESDVSGGTASIALTGGTGSVNLVGTDGITLSEDQETGTIEISGSSSSANVGISARPVGSGADVYLNGGTGSVVLAGVIGTTVSATEHSGGARVDIGYNFPAGVFPRGTNNEHASTRMFPFYSYTFHAPAWIVGWIEGRNIRADAMEYAELKCVYPNDDVYDHMLWRYLDNGDDDAYTPVFFLVPPGTTVYLSANGDYGDFDSSRESKSP